MPYLPMSHRDEIEKVCDLDNVAEYFANKKPGDFEGAINYLNYYIAKKRFAKGGEYRRYAHMNAWVGALECCKQEAYRRIIGPYENEAIQKNGDL